MRDRRYGGAHPVAGGMLFPSAAPAIWSSCPAFREGRFTVQDAAARLAATVAAPAQEDRVLDVCAAPGGKILCHGHGPAGSGQILSCDVHPPQAEAHRQRRPAAGHLTSIRTALADAREEHAAWLEQADVVVADVPVRAWASSAKSRISAIKPP